MERIVFKDAAMNSLVEEIADRLIDHEDQDEGLEVVEDDFDEGIEPVSPITEIKDSERMNS